MKFWYISFQCYFFLYYTNIFRTSILLDVHLHLTFNTYHYVIGPDLYVTKIFLTYRALRETQLYIKDHFLNISSNSHEILIVFRIYKNKKYVLCRQFRRYRKEINKKNIILEEYSLLTFECTSFQSKVLSSVSPCIQICQRDCQTHRPLLKSSFLSSLSLVWLQMTEKGWALDMGAINL